MITYVSNKYARIMESEFVLMQNNIPFSFHSKQNIFLLVLKVSTIELIILMLASTVSFVSGTKYSDVIYSTRLGHYRS